MQKHRKSKYTTPQATIVKADACWLLAGSVSFELNGNGKGDAGGAMSNYQNNVWDDNWDGKTENWLK